MRRAVVIKAVSVVLITVSAAFPVHSQLHSIFGTVSIEGHGNHFGITVWVDSLHFTQTNNYGSYQIDRLANGTYTVKAWAENCLPKIIGTVTISDLNVHGVSGELFPGDVFKDGRINLHDVRVLLDHYLETPDSDGWDRDLDIHRDDVIDALDVELLASRWREAADSGTPFWPIVVIEPDGSTTWNSGQRNIPVRWVAGNTGGDVSIGLYRHGIEVAALVDSTGNDGEHILPELPAGLEEDDGYRIHIFKDDTNQALSEYFSIENSMYITTPDYTTTWWKGEQNVTIEWNPGYETGDVSIFLMTYDTIVDTIASSTSNDGLFEGYDVPLSLTTHGGYRVEIVTGTGYSVGSDNFGIRQVIMVYMPDSTTSWVPGGFAKILWWNRAGLTSTVSLFLYKGDDSLHTIVEGRPYDQEFYHWTVPSDIESGVDYRILARNDDSPVYFDFSDQFSIRPRFQVLRPFNYTNWYTGQQGIAVEWEDSDLGGNVSISLYRGSVPIDEFASATENDGVYVDYDYTVPHDLAEANNCRVLVYHSDRYNDYSDYFDILRPPSPEDFGWIKVSPGTTLWDVSLGGAAVATAVGEQGRIVRTADGGGTWTEQESGTYHALYGVSFSDTLTGTTVGTDGLVLHTVDGGLNWVRQRPGVAKTLFDVSQINGSITIAVGEDGMVIRTVDGGASWEILPSGVQDDLRAVYFTDADNGWAAGRSDRMLRTVDGGDSWTTVNSGISMSTRDICFYSSDVGAVIGSYGCDDLGGCRLGILMASDGGTTWQLKKTGISAFNTIFALAFADATKLTAVADFMVRTTDGGETWVSQPDHMFHYLYGIDYATSGVGISVGTSGVVMRSADAGETWYMADKVINHLMDVEHLDSETAIAAGYDGVILRTTDGGENWNQMNSGTYRGLLSLSFAGVDTGMVAGTGGTILSTVDGGTAWTDRTGGTSSRLWGVELVNGLAAVAVGDNGTIIQTDDGGETWAGLSSGTSYTLRAVSFGSADHGTIVGYGGTILRTSNGGFTWIAQNSGTTTYLYDVEFVDVFNGIAVGASGTILNTSDGGGTWESVASGTSNALVSVTYSDYNTVTIAGEDGLILRSIDGGHTWAVQPCGTTRDLRGISFSGTQDGIIVGRDGTILKTKTGGQ